MGLGVKNTDFYAVGVDYLKKHQKAEVSGLTEEVNQNGDIVNFVVPIDTENEEKYALLCLERIEGKWTVYHHEFLGNHKGRSFNFTLSSSIKKVNCSSITVTYILSAELITLKFSKLFRRILILSPL